MHYGEARSHLPNPTNRVHLSWIFMQGSNIWKRCIKSNACRCKQYGWYLMYNQKSTTSSRSICVTFCECTSYSKLHSFIQGSWKWDTGVMQDSSCTAYRQTTIWAKAGEHWLYMKDVNSLFRIWQFLTLPLVEEVKSMALIYFIYIFSHLVYLSA